MDFVWGAVAFAITASLFVSLRDALRTPALLRRNYADREVVTSVGVVALLGFFVAAALLSLVSQARGIYLFDVGLLGGGFAAIGLLDDVIGVHGPRGFRGHVGAMREGRLTSGLAKLVVGVAIATLATLTTDGAGVQLLRVVVIAGSANVANLLDLRPGRATKFAALALVPPLLIERSNEYVLAGHIMFVGAILSLLPFELREDAMLGDAGANALGAIVGSAWVVATVGNDLGLLCVALAVIALNAAGELVSFSDVIDRVAPLRGFDRLGRRR